MSSIVKKSTHFTPKFKKKKIRSQVQLTPPTTQASQDTPEKQDDHELEPPSETGVFTPEATQLTQSPSFKLTLNKRTTAVGDDDVDPKDASQKVEIEEDSANESNDDEIFRVPTVAKQVKRRLSGIVVSSLRSRSISISKASTPGVETFDLNHVPAKIGIPVAKLVKRRRSLAHIRVPSKRSLLRSATVVLTRDPSPLVEDEPERPPMKFSSTESGLIIGIHPDDRRIGMFRRNGLDADKDPTTGELLPLAPPDLITQISDLQQLPKQMTKEERELLKYIYVDASEMTLKDLCKADLPIGSVSSNYELVQKAEVKNQEQRKQRREDREAARKERVALEVVTARRGEVDNKEELKKQRNELLNGVDEPVVSSTSIRLTLTESGIGVDQDSTVVSRHQRVDQSNLIREDSNPFENPVTSSTYSKRRHTDLWTTEELHQLYESLSMFGTDFSLIAQMFPYRTRKQVKLKVNSEERKRPYLVTLALRRKLPADFDKFCKNANKEIKTLEDYNAELNQLRIEHEQAMELIARQKEQAKKDDAEASRRREIEIRTGSKPMTRAEKIKELRKNEVVMGSIDAVKKQELVNMD